MHALIAPIAPRVAFLSYRRKMANAYVLMVTTLTLTQLPINVAAQGIYISTTILAASAIKCFLIATSARTTRAKD